MTLFKENISERLSRLPLLSALVATSLGIALSVFVVVPLWVAVAGFLLSLGAAWLFHRTAWGGVYIFVTILLLATISSELSRSAEPFERSRMCEIEVDEVTSLRADFSSGYGQVVATYSDNVALPCHLAVRISADSTFRLVAGTRLRAVCRINHYSHADTLSYNRYMARRGFAGGVWLSRESVVSCDTLSGWAYWLRGEALERLARLDLSSDAMATAAAVTLGRREMLSPAIKEDYRRSGGAHLLAVSGLHVGYIYVVIGALLGFMLLVRNGQVWRSVLLVAIMWIYVAVVGFAPSVVRAAVMFSLVQIIVALSSAPLSLNTLCGAATVILWFSPQMLWDTGFVLSCLAVASIVVWGVPLISRFHRAVSAPVEVHRKLWHRAIVGVVEWVLSALIISIVASLATMPLVACVFGLTSLWGIVSGPLVVALCGVAVGATLLWVIFPIGFLASVFGWVIERSVLAMNAVSAWCAERGALIFEGEVSVMLCIGIYLLYIVATLALWSRSRQ